MGGVAQARDYLRHGSFPTIGSGEVPYANKREELRGLSLGEKTRLVMGTRAWAEVMRPFLDALDAARPRKGPAPAYSSEELEACLLYQRLAGERTWEAARARLAGDRGSACRAALGFDVSRQRVGRGLRVVKSLDGVPSEATVRRHRHRWGRDAHLAAYRELFERIVRDHFEEFPELAEEARLVHWDGSVLRSHYTSFERVNRETGEVKPPTLEGGGFRPRTKSNAGKDGHGFNLVSAVTRTGLPLGARLTPINAPEAKTARAIIEHEWRRVVAPWLDDSKVGVMACDAAYSGAHMRQAVHAAGYIPNCHSVSHGRAERSIRNAEEKTAIKRRIKRKPNWTINGHHELSCKCGQGKTMRRAKRNQFGHAVARLEGACENCGPVCLTAGKWRLANNGRSIVGDNLPDERDRIDWRIGNPLTYNDPLSAAYGSARFGHQEGFHGALVTRFGILREKSWYRDRRDAERDVLQVFISMHALAMEQRRRAAAGAASDGPTPMPVRDGAPPGPPPLAAAA
jgi:hypothetical protein